MARPSSISSSRCPKGVQTICKRRDMSHFKTECAKDYVKTIEFTRSSVIQPRRFLCQSAPGKSLHSPWRKSQSYKSQNAIQVLEDRINKKVGRYKERLDSIPPITTWKSVRSLQEGSAPRSGVRHYKRHICLS